MGDEWADEFRRLRREASKPTRIERRRHRRMYRHAIKQMRKREYQASRKHGCTRAAAWLYSYAKTRPTGWPWARS